jgi:heme oxygenase
MPDLKPQHIGASSAHPLAMPLMLRLRTATEAHHRAIESSIGLAASEDAHRRTIAAFYGFVCPWEQELGRLQCEPIQTLTLNRSKTPRLATDLQSFGLSTYEIALLPICLDLPDLSTCSNALGSLYVLEGATLGGQIISRHCERVLGLSGGVGYTYFQGYQGETGAMWRAFGQIVEEHSSDYADDAIIQSACDTFLKLHAWLRTRI